MNGSLNHTVTTGIFAIYPVVVVLTLIGVGDISDHIGRRATMLMGLGASLAGTVLFAVAPDVLWLFSARTLMGVGVGLSAGPSTAAVVEFAAVAARGKFVAARRLDRDGCAGCRLCRSLAAWWRTDRLCAVADPPSRSGSWPCC